MRILLGEDEHELAAWLTRALEQSDFRVDWVDNGSLIQPSLKATRYDVLILDLGLPGLDGHEVLAQLRNNGFALPVLVLTARDSLMERVSTLHEGADDFLAKPFELAELEARLMALVRRAWGSGGSRFACGPLHYDSVARKFVLSDKTLTLTPREHSLLRAMIEHAGEPLSKQELLERVFSDEVAVNPEAIEVLVHRIRKRLAGSSVQITTLRGLGYVLECAQ